MEEVVRSTFWAATWAVERVESDVRSYMRAAH